MFLKFSNSAISSVVIALPSSKCGNKFCSFEKQTASDLGYVAALAIVEQGGGDISEIGVLVFCSKTPDYRSPATACVLQARLGLRTDCAVFDLNSGSVGLLHGLNTVAALMESSGLEAGLLVVGDTTSRLFRADDPAAAHFGDAAAAILLRRDPKASKMDIACFSRGRDTESFFFPQGGFRYPANIKDYADAHALKAITHGGLHLDHKGWDQAACEVLPKAIGRFCEVIGSAPYDFDWVLVQQMGEPVLTQVRNALRLSPVQLPSHEGVPDLCGASIPALLSDCWTRRKVTNPRILACAFGEGLSWGCAAFTLSSDAFVACIETSDCFADGAVSRDF